MRCGALAGVAGRGPTGRLKAEMVGRSASVSRRAWLAGLVSGAGLIAAACGSASTVVLDTPEGRVLQYEGDDLLVLVSGVQPTYHVGDSLHLNLLVNNQST